LTLRYVVLLAVLLVTGCSQDTDTRVFRVPSSSMEPTLHCSRPAPGCMADRRDLVATHSYGSRTPRRGDIVVFTTPPLARLKCGAGGTFIKRLLGLPGETVTEKPGGRISIDGRPLAEPYISAARRRADPFTGSWLVPPRSYFLLGDNRGSSCDSRVW